MAGSRWRTTAVGRGLVRIGAARARYRRGFPPPCCGCRGASSSRRPIRGPMIRRLPRIYWRASSVFAGKVVHAQGQSPFEIAPPSPQWENLLNGFGWLRHLRVAENPMARTNARILVSDFLRLRRNNGDPAWTAPVAARRLMSWISASPFLLEGADLGFYRRFMRSIATMPAICSSGFRAAFRWKTVFFRRSRFAPWPSPRTPGRGSLAAPSWGADRGRSGGASSRMEVT